MRTIVLMIALCVSMAVQAQLYCVDGIYYSVISETNKEVSVRCPNEFYEGNPFYKEGNPFYSNGLSRVYQKFAFMLWEGNAYSGDIEIPSIVIIPELGEDEYTVTEIGEGAFF